MIVAPVQYHRQLLAAVPLRLAHPIVRVPALGALYFKMQATQTLAHHIRRVCAASELLASASREALGGEKLCGFKFAAFAFISRIQKF